MDWVTWPIAVVILGIVAIFVFRGALERLLDRAQSIGPGGVHAATTAKGQTPQGKTQIDDLLKQFDNPLLIRGEEGIKKALGEMNLAPEDRDRLLIRHLAQAWMFASFERAYKNLWGS